MGTVRKRCAEQLQVLLARLLEQERSLAAQKAEERLTFGDAWNASFGVEGLTSPVTEGLMPPY